MSHEGSVNSNIVVCSFYTADEYYRGHAENLRNNLTRLGIAYELEEIVKGEGEDWADICRKKIPFLARVCEQNPDKKVFWIDVDCSLLSLPSFVAEFSGDLIGFQRGFSSPMNIGYANRTRFWEPCFFGINTTAAARRYISDAKTLESNSDIKATDDYFFEESWRSNAPNMSFQIIPSGAVLSKANTSAPDVVAFFSFGSSGNVSEFKGKVVQHGGVGGTTSGNLLGKVRRRALRAAKRVEQSLPTGQSAHLRKVADRVGITHLLTGGVGGFVGRSSSQQGRLVNNMIASGQRGDVETMESAYASLTAARIPAPQEIAAKEAAEAFAHYMTRDSSADPIRLAWWAKPLPGNFGDWLSPLVVGAHTDRSIQYLPPTAPTTDPYLVTVGSIGRFIKPSAIVAGTGISTTDLELEGDATYFSVRGPLTAEVVRRSGGPSIEAMGDPGVLISRVMPVERGDTNGRIAYVPHFKHGNAPVTLSDEMDRLSVLHSRPDSIRRFVEQLNSYDAVVTSAMHVMIACHSYGIPCALVNFEGLETSVHGTGIKYEDYSRGAGLSSIHGPVTVPMDLTQITWDNLMKLEKIDPTKLDEVEESMKMAIAELLERTS